MAAGRRWRASQARWSAVPVAATERSTVSARGGTGTAASARLGGVAQRRVLRRPGHAPRRLRLRVAAAGDTRHTIADEQHEIERRRDEADARLDAAAPGELTRRPDGHGADSRSGRGGPPRHRRRAGTIRGMEGFGFFQDPDFQKRLQEMAEQMQASQSIAWADNAIKLAVAMTVRIC